MKSFYQARSATSQANLLKMESQQDQHANDAAERKPFSELDSSKLKIRIFHIIVAFPCI